MAYEALLDNVYGQIASQLGISLTAVAVVITIISIWSLAWKGVALWKSAKKGHTVWFIILLILNTVGILEILYIFIFSRIRMRPWILEHPKIAKIKSNFHVSKITPSPRARTGRRRRK